MLTRASLRYYAGTNALVVLGVAVAVAVLAGALLVGASVRESLRQLSLARLGQTDAVVTSPTFFRAALADDLMARQPRLAGSAAPVIVAGGAVSHQGSERTAGRVAVYGVDERFGRFHGKGGFNITSREALVSEALAAELGAKAGDAILLRVAKPTDIPLSSLQGRRESTGERIRLTIARVLDRASLGEFSLSPSQGPVLALYVPLLRLQRDLQLEDRVNALLVKGVGTIFAGKTPELYLREQLTPIVTLDDLGLRARPGPAGETIVEGRAGLLTDPLSDQIAKTATHDGRSVVPALTYVANVIRIGNRDVPYSTVTAINLDRGLVRGPIGKESRPPIWLNEWAAEDLRAKIGDTVTLEYFLWSDEDGLETDGAEFVMAGVVPMSGLGGDQTLTPEYPGISDATDISSWDPPFPVDLQKVRKQDEDYWDRHRAAPKAIVSLADGQRLWGSRYGKLSSLRLSGTSPISARQIDPAVAGFSVQFVRQQAIDASQGTTDFGQYFLYFSFFLVVSALLLAYLFFAVGLEQRTTEVGALSAVGFSPSGIRWVFIREGAILAAVGAITGALAAVAYGAVILYGLRTWWVGAVGTTDLVLHIDPAALAAGVIGAFVVGLAALWGGIRAMSRRSARSLLKGDGAVASKRAGATTKAIAVLLALGGMALLALSMTRTIDPTAGFFGAGGSWLVASLCAASLFLRRRPTSGVFGRGARAMLSLGVRHTAVRPARSVLSLALIAFASFVLVSVGAFKKEVAASATDSRSGIGGYALMGEAVAPLMYDPNTPAGRRELGIAADDPIVSSTGITRFRLRPGDEASCLTLYRPTNPRIIAPEPRFYDTPRFSFAASMASTPEEHANPWLLLARTFDDGAVAAIADQTTLMYSLHLGVGDDFTFTPEGHAPVRLRIVGALADSFLQSELIVGEDAFVRLFPRHEGYRVWMIGVPPGQEAAVTTHLEEQLSDYGLDVIDTHQRWAAYHQIENTYLATFQALGSLGLLLGTAGLGAVLARNILERRREIGLLRAVGYSPGDIRNMVLSEGLSLVLGGLVIGAGCALVAIAPALLDRAQALPLANLAGLAAAVFSTGVVASWLAIRVTSRVPVTTAIKAE